MNQLEQIFSDAPALCEEVRLSCRVYFKAPVAYILTGWLYVGSTWQRIEALADQPSISQAQLGRALLAAGWSMDDRPTKRSALEFTYTFKRATGEHYNFQLRSKTADYTERRGTERAMQAIDSHISGAILQVPEYDRLWA